VNIWTWEGRGGRRLRFVGYIEQMGGMKNVYKILVRKPEET